MKNFLIFISYRDGDCEYTEIFIRKVKIPTDIQDFDEIKDLIAIDLGYEPSDYDDDDEGWWCGSRIFDFTWRDIESKKHLKILKEYL